MSDDISKLIIAAVSALIGFLASIFIAYFTNRSISKREADNFARTQASRRADLYRERGEELYVKVDSMLAYVYGRALRYREVALNRKTATTAFDEDLVASRDLSDVRSRVPLLIDAYFPTLQSKYQDLLTAIENLDRTVVEIGSSQPETTISSDNKAESIDLAGIEVQERGSVLKRGIAEEIRAV